MRPRRSRAPAYAAWCAVVMLLFNSCADHRSARATGVELASGTYRPSMRLLVRVLAAAGTDDGDINRYFAYANACLGRPYQGYYVRDPRGWSVDGRQFEDDRDPNDPRVIAPVVPPGARVPYRDFSVEYPPGFFLIALPPALLAHDMDSYRILFSLWMALLLTLALLLCERLMRSLDPSLSPSLIRWATISAIALGTISLRRFDATVSLSLCLLAWGAATRRPILAGMGLALGIASKGLPLLLAPLPLLYYASEKRGREARLAALSTVATGLLVALPFVLLCGRHLFDVVGYHGQRTLEVESTGGALVTLGHALGLVRTQLTHTFGSSNLVTGHDRALRTLSLGAVLVALGLVCRRVQRALAVAGSDRERLGWLLRGMAAVLVTTMTLGPVLSPQYLVWLLPLGVLVSLLDGKSALYQLVIALALTQLIYPVLFRLELGERLHPLFATGVLARNGLLLVWAWQRLHPRREVSARVLAPRAPPATATPAAPPSSR